MKNSIKNRTTIKIITKNINTNNNNISHNITIINNNNKSAGKKFSPDENIRKRNIYFRAATILVRITFFPRVVLFL